MEKPAVNSGIGREEVTLVSLALLVWQGTAARKTQHGLQYAATGNIVFHLKTDADLFFLCLATLTLTIGPQNKWACRTHRGSVTIINQQMLFTDCSIGCYDQPTPQELP